MRRCGGKGGGEDSSRVCFGGFSHAIFGVGSIANVNPSFLFTFLLFSASHRPSNFFFHLAMSSFFSFSYGVFFSLLFFFFPLFIPCLPFPFFFFFLSLSLNLYPNRKTAWVYFLPFSCNVPFFARLFSARFHQRFF